MSDKQQTPDNQRTKDLHDYLVKCFANTRKKDGTINKRALGRRLTNDEEKGRTLADKLCDSKPITTGDLVGFIAGLQASGDPEKGQLLTPEEVLIALLKLIDLTPDEREQLGLSLGEEQVLLQQVLLNIWLNQKHDYGKLLKLYRTSIGLDEVQEEQRQTSALKQHIEQLIKQIAEQSLQYLPEGEYRQRQLRELSQKTQREVERILLRGGGQVQLEKDRGDDYIRAYLPDGFIEKLTKAVIENEVLTQIFPIYIKTITIQECAPLPLPISDRFSARPGLFHAPFLDLDPDKSQGKEDKLHGKEIASQYAHKVTVHFYIRLPPSYQPPEEVKDVFAQIRRDDLAGQRIDFSVSSTGIGGTLSHIIKIINSTLLSNIPGLAEYFPIAHDVVVHEEIIRNNIPSPIWAHTLVRLCKTETLSRAMSDSSEANQLIPYERFAFGDRTARGEYCGFDLILCPAIAALQARLRAIRYTGITPDQYLKELTDRILQHRCLQEARKYVTAYPFSSFAQENYLLETLLRDWSSSLKKDDPYIWIEACLTIAETYLNEGLYRRSWLYLKAVEKAIKRISDSGLDWYKRFGRSIPTETDFKIFSGTLLVYLELCRALYFYYVNRLAELGKREYLPDYIPEDMNLKTFHETLLSASWEALNRAEKHLTIRLAKYFLIHEVSQGTFHPHYHLLAKIYFLRARILTFFPEVPYDDADSPHRLPTDRNVGDNKRNEAEIHEGRLYLLEKARLYAASDGDTERYSCYTAYQSWIYWIVYFARHQFRSQSGILPRDCNLWAKQLRDHALLSYTDVGRKCYYQIKEKSGVEKPLVPNLKNYDIGPIPPIVETRRLLNNQQPEDGEVLYLEMTYLAVQRGWLNLKDGGEPNETIYLFGAGASYLLFARGMYQLCSLEKQEFSEAPIKTVADWDEKLKVAYRLFSYAWAMADAGGTIETVSEVPGSSPPAQPTQRLKIKRDFALSNRNGHNRDVASVRDLYPNQTSEITDLAQVFAATCATLRLYTASVEERDALNQDIEWLLQNLQKPEFCQQPGIARQLREQPCFNGHLTSYLVQCKHILQEAKQQAQRSQNPARDASFITEQRDALVRKLFNTLHDR
ncbi:hypothetical protein [Leptolyngbya sp. FACHB-711]|uniref:hypothetical protein n=1 Tax=unclassified Leptolyngbya TaxID=2650499 RepID=UPI001682CC8B|nr:hypothetical protein [Leptolyngbya sp. FACHB-711]MBD2025520.1 hypothetical protein [Leptolyngbya sp. FACHB-711]